jgi:hypothetical protein
MQFGFADREGAVLIEQHRPNLIAAALASDRFTAQQQLGHDDLLSRG